MTIKVSLDEVALLASLLRMGGVVAYPTESVFGLGCDPMSERAVSEVVRLKSRSAEQRLLLIAHSLTDALPWVSLDSVPSERMEQVQASWPGPSTWIFPASLAVPHWLAGTAGNIAIRVTAHRGAAELCRAFGGALVSTSANPHGAAPARDAADVLAYFPSGLDGVLLEPVGGLPRPSTIRHALTGEVIRP